MIAARQTPFLRERTATGREDAFNFQFANKIQKQFSPLYAKRVLPEWHDEDWRASFRTYVAPELVDHFKEVEVFERRRVLPRYVYANGIAGRNSRRALQRIRSFGARLRRSHDYFVDIPWEGEIVRARYRDGKLLLHKGADRYLELPRANPVRTQISPTRDTRLRWMQSVIRCTHYVAGAERAAVSQRSGRPRGEFRASAKRFPTPAKRILDPNEFTAAQNRDHVFSAYRRERDSGDRARVRARGAAATKFTSSATLNPFGSICRSDNLHFHQVDVAHNPLFPSPGLHPAARGEDGGGRAFTSSSIFSMFITRCRTHSPPFWLRRC